MNRIVIEPHDPPSQRPIQQAVAELHNGNIAGYPTDTLYALGCAIDSKKGIAALHRIKSMDRNQRLALLCPDLSTAALYAHFSQTAFRVAQRVFPGPFTLVLPATREVPKTLQSRKRRNVGIRISAHPVTAALVRELGRPLLTTSAIGPEGERCCDADEVADHFSDGLDLLVDSGPTPGDVSTVVVIDGEDVEIARQGLGILE